MKKHIPVRAAAAVLTAAVLAAAFLLPAGAAGGLYVNDSGSTLSEGLGSAYAVGSGGAVSKLTDSYAYVMTGTGLATVGEAAIPIPAHLTVSGSVKLAYSQVRVGLYYYDSASSVRNPTLDSANLENAVGSGYRFGYYDAARTFHEVGYTGETRITMCTDKNLDLSGGHVGCYHILLNGTYGSYDQALSAAGQYDDAFPAYYNGVYRVLVGDYDAAADATADAAARGISGQAYSASSRCVVVTRTADARILFEYDCGTDSSLTVRPSSGSGKAQTWFKGYKYYGDFEYVRRTGGKITVINIVDIEDYVKGVITSEMSATWPLEALKAQALCARTFTASNFGTYSSYGFDVTNDTYSQAYRGLGLATDRSDSAVDQTAGQYLTYNGKLISALYYSSNGGGSENSENVFSAAYAYLKGKEDPFEAAISSINGKSAWSFTVSKADVYAALKRYNYRLDLTDVSGISVTYSDTGNAVGLALTDSAGKSATLLRSSCYSFSTGYLSLPSIHYTVEDKGTSFVFTGGGWGHSVGMSQFGAYAMASKYGYTYDQIVNFYYTGVSLSTGYAG